MKSNQVSVLVVLLLCLVMGGFLYIVDRSSDEEAGWTPSELYGELGARSYEGSSFSDVTFSGGGNSDGVAVSMRNGSFSLRTRARHTSSPSSPIAKGVPGKSADFWGALSPNRPIASSPNSLIGHMTSSAEFHSFGGGSNMAMGSYTSSSNNLIASSPAIGSYSPSPIAYNPITSSPNNLIAYSPSNGEVQVAAEQALMSASSSASGLFGGMMTSYGTASYDQTNYGSYGSTPSRVSGQKRLPGSGGSGGEDDSPFGWLAWLANYARNNGTAGSDGSYGFDVYQLSSAYQAWLNEWMAETGLTEDKAPSFNEFLNWFYEGNFTYSWTDSQGNDQSTSLHWVPVGNILPLLVLALIYIAYLVFRRRKVLVK